ncbi:GNAT family N-acetyltransferase [Actinophytocola sp.]|uniref:GNAT family N-acetyltransferase n=1 Tax=Actinophytocola sp. TaxID=1872138 RepID=UPI002D806A1C|nr:GNAT family N-acetyltransferase [Actinophytocola sp.]HET9139965.1 GNAT family N-acetyltransferase [Actinophytocola sp.]
MSDLLQLSDLEIRPASWADLHTLTEALGQRRYFSERLAHQQQGKGVLFTAWKHNRPAGHVYLRLEIAEEAEIRRFLPGVPFLTHLEVLREYRNGGIGTTLIATAEENLRDLRYGRVALAVEVSNVRAARLYERLGYVGWGCGEVVCHSVFDGDAAREERCDVLVKRLRL